MRQFLHGILLWIATQAIQPMHDSAGKFPIRHQLFIGGKFVDAASGETLSVEVMREYTQVKSVWVNVDAKIAPWYPR
jgi:hypothetical protein